MSATFVCRCGYATADLSLFLDHHEAAHDTAIPTLTGDYRSTAAVGKRRADDPYYAARDAARAHYDPDAEDRAILAARARERHLWADAG